MFPTRTAHKLEGAAPDGKVVERAPNAPQLGAISPPPSNEQGKQLGKGAGVGIGQSGRKRQGLATAEEVFEGKRQRVRPRVPPVPVSTPLTEVFNPRLLLITCRTQMETQESLMRNHGPAGSDEVKCGLCMANVAPRRWVKHLGRHYGVGWMVDKETPINVEDRKVVLEAIRAFVREHPNRELPCRMCYQVSPCATAVLEHLESCGISDSLGGSGEYHYSAMNPIDIVAVERQYQRPKLGRPVSSDVAPDETMKPRQINIESLLVCSKITLPKTKWINFMHEHYTDGALFRSSVPKYLSPTLRGVEELKKFNHYSMHFTYALKASLGDVQPPDWSHLCRFESTATKGESVCYAGGSVSAVFWVPLPASVRTQYMAVLFKLDHTKNSNFIMFFGVAENMQITLHLCVHIIDGPVRTIAFLPSGGFTMKSNRLGLMAVGTGHNTTIHIYPVPIELLRFQKPYLVTLIAHYALKWNTGSHKYNACTTIRWSESRNHNLVFAGYDNGYIGVWDVTEAGNMNFFHEVTGPHSFAPCSYIFVHTSGVVSFDVHYDANGPRWIAAQSGNHRCTIYDIADLCKPVIVKVELFQNMLRCLDWSPIWATIAVAFFYDANAEPHTKKTNSSAVSLAQIIQNVQRGPAMGMVSSVHYSPWLNMLVCGKVNGDVIFYACRQANTGDTDIKFMQNAKAVMSTACQLVSGLTIPKSRSKTAKATTPEDTDNTALLFGRLQMSIPDGFVDLSEPEPEQRIAAVRFNTNPRASSMLCVAYEIGLIRVIHYKDEMQSQH